MAEENKEKGGRGSKLRLINSLPRLVDDCVEVVFEAMYIDKNENVIEGALVDFYDDWPKEYYVQKKTNSEGKATFKYRKQGLDVLGKKKSIRAQVHGTAVEAINTVDLLPDYGEGWYKLLQCSKRNYAKKKLSIVKYVGRTLLIFLPALVVVNGWFLGSNLPIIKFFDLSPKTVPVLFGLTIGSWIFRKFWKDDKLSTKKGIYYWLGCIGAGFLIATLANDIISFAILFVLWSLAAYILEELTYIIEYEKEGNKATVKWSRWVNFYPWYPMYLALLLSGLHVLGLVSDLILFFIGHYPGTIDLGYIINLNNTAELSFLPSNLKFISYRLINIAGWMIGFFLLLLYASPGEFMGLLKGGKEDVTAGAGKIITKVFFFKELFDQLHFFRTRAKK
ncbi:hypothetical protein KAR28_05215 [Candidatus Parcubacteria bacterium]|nr:hypothetical protein [Candidatus Parcubacteria bacterium]